MDIPRGTELLVWYNDSYTSFFGIPLQCIAQDENREKTFSFLLFFPPWSSWTTPALEINFAVICVKQSNDIFSSYDAHRVEHLLKMVQVCASRSDLPVLFLLWEVNREHILFSIQITSCNDWQIRGVVNNICFSPLITFSLRLSFILSSFVIVYILFIPIFLYSAFDSFSPQEKKHGLFLFKRKKEGANANWNNLNYSEVNFLE